MLHFPFLGRNTSRIRLIFTRKRDVGNIKVVPSSYNPFNMQRGMFKGGICFVLFRRRASF